MAITSGLYELHSMLLTAMVVDVAGGSAVRGANVQLYSTNDSNAQKFYLVEESAGKWSIQNAASLMYMDVASGAAANGTNVQQWSDNDSRAQRWNVIDSGSTVTVAGETCPVVTLGSYVTDDGATYVADVSKAMTTNKTNIQLWRSNNSPAQRFALYPTTLQDPSMPAPSGRGWATTLGAASSQSLQPTQSVLYPCWYFTDAWLGLQQHGFEVSYRTRLIANGMAAAGNWSGWSAWSAEDVTLYGQTAWLTNGLPAAFDTTAYKRMEYALRVRSTSVVNGIIYHSKPITMSLAAVYAPTVTCTGAKRVYDAIRLTFTSDYTGGATAVRVTKLWGSGGTVLKKPIIGYGYAPQFTVDIPAASFAAGIGSTTLDLNVSYEVGTDQYPATGITHTDPIQLTNGSGKTLQITANGIWLQDESAWQFSMYGGSSYAAYLITETGQVDASEVSPGVFKLYPPFGSESCTMILYAQNVDGTRWWMLADSISGDDKPCHMWNWHGGHFRLAVLDGYLQTSRTLKADYSEHQLSGREWHSLSFATTLGGEFSAEGTLVDGLTDETKAQLMELMKAHSAVYRAPSGEVAEVGITEIQYQTVRRRTNVSISMVQVTR